MHGGFHNAFRCIVAKTAGNARLQLDVADSCGWGLRHHRQLGVSVRSHAWATTDGGTDYFALSWYDHASGLVRSKAAANEKPCNRSDVRVNLPGVSSSSIAISSYFPAHLFVSRPQS